MTGFVKTGDILGGKYEDGAKVKIRGWIYTSRSSGGIQFLELRDGSGVIQCTLNKRNVGEETFDKIEKYPNLSSWESFLTGLGLLLRGCVTARWVLKVLL